MELVLLASSWPPFWMKVSKFKRWLTVARRPLGAGEWSKTIVVTGLPVFQIKKMPNKYRDDHHINKINMQLMKLRKESLNVGIQRLKIPWSIKYSQTSHFLISLASCAGHEKSLLVIILITCFSKELGWFCIKISSTAKKCLSVIFTKSWK